MTVWKGMRHNVMVTAADSVFYRFNDSLFIHHNSWIPFSPAASFWMWDGAVCLFLCGHSNCTLTTSSCERIHYKLYSAFPCSQMGISITVDADRPPTGDWNYLQPINQSSLTNLFWKSTLDVLFAAFSYGFNLFVFVCVHCKMLFFFHCPGSSLIAFPGRWRNCTYQCELFQA